MVRFYPAVLVAGLLSGVPVTVPAQSASASVQVRTVVPVICEVAGTSMSPTDFRAELKCNVAHRVTLSFTGPAGAAEMTHLGQTRTASPDTPTVTWESDAVFNGARVIRLKGGASPDEVRITVTPL